MTPPVARPRAAIRRRELAFDVAAALIVALLVVELTAGLGVVAFIALPLFLLGLLWIAGEGLLGWIVARRRGNVPQRSNRA